MCNKWTHMVQKMNRKTRIKCKQGFLVGCARGNYFKIYYPETGKSVFFKDVRFDENYMLWNFDPKLDSTNQMINLRSLFQAVEKTKEPPHVQTTIIIEENETALPEHNEQVNMEGLTYYPPEKRTSGQERTEGQRFSPSVLIAPLTRYARGISDTTLPNGYTEALEHQEEKMGLWLCTWRSKI